MTIILGIFALFFIFFIFPIALVAAIIANVRFPAPKGLSRREVKRYYAGISIFASKMPLPQTLDAEKIEQELISHNAQGIIYEEFKAFAKRRFIVAKNGLIYNGKVIPYEYLSFISIDIAPSPVTCGIATIMINGKATMLGYKFRDRHRAKLAFNYINTVANPDEPWPNGLAYWEYELDKWERNEWENSLETEAEFEEECERDLIIAEELAELRQLDKEDKINSKKTNSEWTKTLLLCLFLGHLGAHRFYTGKIVSGIVYIITIGCMGIGPLVDLILILSGNFKKQNGELLTRIQN